VAFSHHSEAQRTAQEYDSPLCLLDGLFAHPAWLFNVVSHLNIRDGDRGQNEFFRSLLVPYYAQLFKGVVVTTPISLTPIVGLAKVPLRFLWKENAWLT
jgi:hypothetical protein